MGYKHFSSHSDYPVIFVGPEKLNNKYKEFLRDYMSDCSTADHLHAKIKEFQLLKSQIDTSKQKAFALMYTTYIDFSEYLILNIYIFRIGIS